MDPSIKRTLSSLVALVALTVFCVVAPPASAEEATPCFDATINGQAVPCDNVDGLAFGEAAVFPVTQTFNGDGTSDVWWGEEEDEITITLDFDASAIDGAAMVTAFFNGEWFFVTGLDEDGTQQSWIEAAHKTFNSDDSFTVLELRVIDGSVEHEDYSAPYLASSYMQVSAFTPEPVGGEALRTASSTERISGQRIRFGNLFDGRYSFVAKKNGKRVVRSIGRLSAGRHAQVFDCGRLNGRWVVRVRGNGVKANEGTSALSERHRVTC